MIVTEPINIAELLEQAHKPEAGGIVLFSGEVRNNHKNKTVSYLEYEAHTAMAEKMMREIVEQAKVKWSLLYAFAVHRIGRIKISESAVVVITAHAHRKAAYEANQWIIDKIKSEVPIWKCEYYSDGTHEWGKNEIHSVKE